MVKQKWTKTEVGRQRKLARLYQNQPLQNYMSKRIVPILETDEEVREWYKWATKKEKK